MKKIAAFLFLSILTTLSLRADVLFQDSTNYPYTDGCIEGQGQWYAFSTKTGSTNALDARVTNNVLFLSSTAQDSVGTPTNGWVNPGTLTWASFTINVSQPPQTPGYFFELRDATGNSVCHVFNTAQGTTIPGTYRLGIGNFSTTHNDFPLDLSTGITYTVVIAYDTTIGSPFEGANLMINPSFQDYNNLANQVYTGPGMGVGFVYGTDTTGNTNLLNIHASYIGFSPYANAGIGNVIAGTDFTNVVSTNLPVIGIQPQSSTDYSGNPHTFYVAASGVDLTYQWYSSGGALVDDGINIVGSTNNILTINSLASSDSYYVIATDAYGHQVTSATAYETVITTPTAPFFPPSVVATNATNNLFTTGGFTNIALGTGPLSYQWYFAPTNTPNTFSALPGQNSSSLSLFLGDYSYLGNYYVQASSSLGSTNGPTNSLAIIAPLQASILQLHNFMVASRAQIKNSSTLWINSNNVAVSGYVTTYGGFGSHSYTEFFIQDTNGYGIEIYLNGHDNTNNPPIGSYVTVTAPVEVYNTGLEMFTADPTAISAPDTNAPPFALQPVLCNSIFTDLVTNPLGTNALLLQGSLITFTNVVCYKYKNPLTNGSLPTTFFSNSYTSFYFDIGGTNVSGTNTLNCYQFGYNYGTNTFPNFRTNEFNNKRVPTNCYQLTGVYLTYNSGPEILPCRLADYVTNRPVLLPTLTRSTKNVTSVSLNPQVGSTYSVYTATNITGPWARRTYGLGYYPTNVTFVETNTASKGFYRVTSP
jgi:hypothetical protein